MRSKEFTVPTEYILYVGDQPVQKYDQRVEALKAWEMLSAKFPNRKFSVHAEICQDKVLTDEPIEELIQQIWNLRVETRVVQLVKPAEPHWL